MATSVAADPSNKKYIQLVYNNPYMLRIWEIVRGGPSLPTRHAVPRCKHGMPKILESENGRTLINPRAPYPDEEEALTPANINSHNMISTEKFIIKSYGDWYFDVRMVKASNFKSRTEFDTIMENYETKLSEIVPRISLVDAFEKLGVHISPDKEHLLKLATEDQKDKYDMWKWRKDGEKYYWDQVLNSFLVNLFGKTPINDESYEENEMDKKKLYISDLHVYSRDGNYKFWTAKHGDYYLYMEFFTS